MAIGARAPRGQVGAVDDEAWEFYGGDPSSGVGLARPIGWRVLKPDGTGAWDKTGSADTAWTAVGSGGGQSVATLAALAGLDASTMLDGTQVYVQTLKDVFQLETTSIATTSTTVIAASGAATKRWIRLNLGSIVWAAATTWAIDTALGSDENTGAGGSPLLTVSELARRLSNQILPVSVVVTVTGSMGASDLPVFSFRCAPAATFTLTFTPTTIYSSTIGVVTAAAAGAGTGDNNFTDPAIPGGSFTAAGALAAGVIGTRGGTSYFWFALDKGATTARISKPSAALANGEAYSAQSLPDAQTMRFSEQRYNAVIIQFGRIVGGPWTDASLRFDRCWFNALSSLSLPSCAYANCAFDGDQNLSQVGGTSRGAVFTTGGMMRGTGAQSFVCSLGNRITAFNGSMTLQGCALIAQGFMVISVDQYANDVTHAGGAFQASYWGIMLWYASGATASLVGSGNTNYLLYADRMSQIACAANPLVAGSSPSGTPVRASGSADASVANFANGALVLNRSGNGVYLTNMAGDASLVAVTGNAAPAAAAVVMNNAPAGSPAAPARYAQVPDGAGGVYTFPSLT